MMRNKKFRLNPVKLVRMVSLTLLIAFSVFFTFKSTASGLTTNNCTEIVVGTGETLWQIADKHNKDENIQEVLYSIVEYNNLEGTNIYPGQKLKIPTNY